MAEKSTAYHDWMLDTIEERELEALDEMWAEIVWDDAYQQAFRLAFEMDAEDREMRHEGLVG